MDDFRMPQKHMLHAIRAIMLHMGFRQSAEAKSTGTSVELERSRQAALRSRALECVESGPPIAQAKLKLPGRDERFQVFAWWVLYGGANPADACGPLDQAPQNA